MSYEFIPKSLQRNLKYIIFSYAIINIIYMSIRFYSIASEPHVRTRRSLVEPIPQTKGSFFVAPYTQDMIEEDEEEEMKRIIYFDQHYIKEDLNDRNIVLQSKLYSGSMGPSDITPYYSRATAEFDKEDISISTIVTHDRFQVLSRLASRYKGPISATVHVNDDDQKASVLHQLEEISSENPDMRSYVDIHLVIDKFDRQFNMWRNIAKLYARTDYIMMLDIDFYVCTDFRNYILQDAHLMDMLRTGRTALVVPAFEYIDHADGYDFAEFPQDKDRLLQQVFEDEKIDMFHRTWQKGHSATNYIKWYTSEKPYKVKDYNFSYEPYVIFKRETSPWCDERFIGYGANKAACLYEIYISGIDYYVLPNDFLIHQSHAYPEEARKRERLFNRKVYANFREELCLRYARQFVAAGQWKTSVSKNLRKECNKIRGFKNIMQNIDK